MRYLLALLIAVSATLSAGSAPEISILREATDIANGGTDTIYGTSLGTSRSITYTIANTGTAALNIAAPITLSSVVGVTTGLTQPSSTSIAANSATTFSITVTPTVNGTWSLVVNVPNDDSNENPTTWTITGTSSASSAPEIVVLRNGSNVTSGVSVAVNGTRLNILDELSFVVQNIGNSNLTITSINAVDSASCFIDTLTSPSASIASGASTTFTVQIQPVQTSWSCSVVLTCNDSDESTFTIPLTGTASTVAAPEFKLTSGSNVILNGSTWSAASGTPGTQGTPIEFTISNLGDGQLTGVGVSFPRLVNATAAIIQAPSGTVNGLSSTTFRIAITPTSSGNWLVDVAVANNDAGESPTTFTLRSTSGGGGGAGGGDASGGGGGCGAGGAVAGLLVALGLLSLRRRR